MKCLCRVVNEMTKAHVWNNFAVFNVMWINNRNKLTTLLSTLGQTGLFRLNTRVKFYVIVNLITMAYFVSLLGRRKHNAILSEPHLLQLSVQLVRATGSSPSQHVTFYQYQCTCTESVRSLNLFISSPPRLLARGVGK